MEKEEEQAEDAEDVDLESDSSTPDEMVAAAQQGDVQSLLKIASGRKFRCFVMPKLMSNLEAALHVVRKDDPVHLINEIFGQMLVFQGTLLLRAQLDVMDRFSNTNHPQEPSQEMIERVERLQRTICETSTVFSRVKHSLTLSADPMKPVKPLADRKLSIVARPSDAKRTANA